MCPYTNMNSLPSHFCFFSLFYSSYCKGFSYEIHSLNLCWTCFSLSSVGIRSVYQNALKSQDLHRSKPDKILALWRKLVISTPNQKAVCNCCVLGKGTSVFPDGATCPKAGSIHRSSWTIKNRASWVFCLFVLCVSFAF